MRSLLNRFQTKTGFKKQIRPELVLAKVYVQAQCLEKQSLHLAYDVHIGA
jgi:hypothetical protein